MKEEELTIGFCPSEEEAVQMGTPDYHRNAREQCKAYIEAIRNFCGREPKGARLAITAHLCDFGTYWEVAVKFDPTNEAAVEYAYKCEGEGPRTWEEGEVGWPPQKVMSR